MPSAVAATVTFLKTVGLAVGGLTLSAGQALALGAATVVAGAVAAQKLITELYKVPSIDSDRSRQATVRGTVEPQKLIYGEALVSGPISFVGVSGTDNRDLYHSIVLAGHPSDSISDIYFDDERIQSAHINASGNVTTGTFGPKDGTTICVIRKLTGSQTTADSVLDGAFFTINSSEHIGTNLTYIVTKFTLTDKSQETWDKFMPNDIKALVKGKKVYDPRQDSTSTYYDANVGVGTQRASDSTTWEWSENPVWCLVDYLTDNRFGMGIALNRIDLGKAVDAADICDATVSVPGGATEKRYTCNGVIFGTTTHKTNINKLLSSMNGMLTYTNGNYVIRAGAFESVGTGMTLTEDHMIGPVKLKTSFERNERFNTITGTFIDPSKNYKEIEFPKVQITSALTRDNNEELTQELKLSMTNSRYMAQRIAHKLIQLSDLQKVLTFPTNLAGVNISVGDRVNVTLSEFGYTNKTFVCLGWTLSESGTGGVNLTLREDDSSSYADLAVSGYSTVTPAGGIQQGFFGVPDPSGLSATAHVESIELDWTNPANMTGIIAIEVFASPNSSWSSAVKIGETIGTQFIHDESNGVDSIVEGDQRYYWVRARRFPSGEGSDAVSDRNPDSDTSTVQATKGALGALANADTVGDTEIDDNAIRNRHIDDNAVDTNEINDGAVTVDKLTVAELSAITADIGDITAGTLQANTSTPIPDANDSPSGSETGAFIDLDNGKFVFGDANKHLLYDGSTLLVKGELEADILDVIDATITGQLTANAISAGAVTVESLSAGVFAEFDDRYGTSGGFYVTDTDEFFDGNSTKYVTVGTVAHSTDNIYFECRLNHSWSWPRNDTGDKLNANVSFEYSTDNSTWTTVPSSTTQVATATGVVAQYATLYSIAEDITYTMTGSALTAGNYYFRVKIVAQNSTNAFQLAAFGGGSGVPIAFEVQESSGLSAAGGNADTLDGLDSTQFLRSDTNDTFNGDLTITGQLILNGSIDQYNVTDLNVSDKTITVNSGSTQSLSDGAGLIVDRGTAADASITWDETNDRFIITDGIKTSNLITIETVAPETRNTLLFLNANDQFADIIASDNGGSVVYRNNQGAFQLYVDGSANSSATSNAQLALTIADTKAATFASTVSWSGGSSANANTAYTYSQVGHLPLAGGNVTGDLSVNTDNFFVDVSTGRVGIGEDVPVKTLNVVWDESSTAIGGSGLSGGAAGGGILLRNSNTTAGTYANLDFRADTADGRIAFVYNSVNNGDFHFVTDNASPSSKMIIHNEGDVDIFGGLETTGNIVNDIGNSGDDSFIELKNTGYTGNVTSLRQNADSTRAELNSTQRPIYIQAGSGGGSANAEVRLYANQQLGLTIDASRAATFGGTIDSGAITTTGLLHLDFATSTSSSATGTTFLKIDNYVGSDLNQQKSFIDFIFQDDNTNETPQVRIGAEVGQNGDANSQEKEGSGAFVVYTNNAENVLGDAGASLAERFRVDYVGNVDVVTGALKIGGTSIIGSNTRITAGDGTTTKAAYGFQSSSTTGLSYSSSQNRVNLLSGGAVVAYAQTPSTNPIAHAFYVDGTMAVNGQINWSGGNSGSANTAYTYSQVGHLPLAGGTVTGNVTLDSANPVLDVLADGDADATIRLRETGTGIVGTELVYDGGTNEFLINIGNNPPVNALTINRDTRATTFAGTLLVSTGTVGSDPNTLKIETATEANTAIGAVYASLEFAVSGAENSTGTVSGGVVSAIKAIDYRSGTTSYEDAGIGFYTLDSDESAPVFRGGFSNAGGFFVADDGVVDTNLAQGDIYAVGNITAGNNLQFNNSLKFGSTVLIDTAGTLNGINIIAIPSGDFVVTDGNNSPGSETNIIWRDHSADRLYLGTTTDVVEFRGNVNFQSGHTLSHNGQTILDASRNLSNIGTISSANLTITSDTRTEIVPATSAGNGVGLLFSDHLASTGQQQAYLDYFHQDSKSYGSANSFIFSTNQTDVSVVIDGKLLFRDSLHMKPATGTDTSGTTIIDSSRNLQNVVSVTSTGAIKSETAVTNAVTSSYAYLLSKHVEAGMQVIADDGGDWGPWMGLTHANSSTAVNKHYWFHNAPSTATTNAGNLEIRYSTTTTAAQIGGQGSGSTAIAHFGNSGNFTIAGRMTSSDGTLVKAAYGFASSSTTGISYSSTNNRVNILSGGAVKAYIQTGSSNPQVDTMYVDGLMSVNGSISWDGGSSALANVGYNKRLNSFGFNTADGVLTATLGDNTTLTVDLNGRYAETTSTTQNITANSYLSGLGTAASPAFKVGDTDSGFYDSGANEIGVTLGGVLEYEFTPTQFNMAGNSLVTTGTLSSGAITSSGTITTSGSFVGVNAILDNILAKASSGNILFKTNAGASIARFNNNLSADFFGTISSGAITASSTITNASSSNAYLILKNGGSHESGMILQKGSANKWEAPYISNANDNLKFYSYTGSSLQLEIRDGVNGNGGTIFSGLKVSDNNAFYGSYGALLLNTTQSYTSTSRGWMITNAYQANKFALLYSNSATTLPALTTYGTPASGTSVALQIDNSGSVTFGGTISSGVHTITSSGTIGGATIANGYLKVTDGTDTLGIDPNEIMSSDRLFLQSADGEIFLRGNNSAGVKLFNGGTQFMSADRNLFSIGTIASGEITATGNIKSSGVAHPEFELIPTGSVGNADIRFDGTSLDIRSNSTSAYLTLQTSTTERLKITNTGNFEFNGGNFSEVGTINAETAVIEKTQLNGVVLTLRSDMADLDGSGGRSDGVAMNFEATDDNATFTPQAQIRMIVKDYSGDSGIQSEGTGNLAFYTGVGSGTTGSGSLNEVMRLMETGNVSIGSTDSVEKLYVYEDDSAFGNTTVKIHNNKTDDAAVLYLEGKRTSSNDAAQVIGANNGNVVTNIRTYSGGDNGSLRFYTSVSGTGSTVQESLRIQDNGGVAIGNYSTSVGAGGLIVDNDIKTNSRLGIGSSGSVSAPAIYKNSDTNTGIYFPDADEVGIVTGGNERVRVDSDGTLLYKAGSANARTLVAIIGSNSTRPVLQFSESSATTFGAGMSIEYNGYGTGDANYMVINDINSNPRFKVYSGGQFEVISDTRNRIYSTTNAVGAGLEFSDAVSESYAQAAYIDYRHLDGQSFGSGNAFRITSNQSTLSFAVDGSVVMSGSLYVNDSYDQTTLGDQIIGSNKRITVADGTSVKAAYGFISDATTGMIKAGTEQIGFITGAAERVRITSDGIQTRSGKEIRAYRADNARDIRMYCDNSYGYLETSTDPLMIKSANRIEFRTNGNDLRATIENNGDFAMGSAETVVIDASRNAYFVDIDVSGDIVMSGSNNFLVIENSAENNAGIVFNDLQAGAWPAASSQRFMMQYNSGGESGVGSMIMGHDDDSYNGFYFKKGGALECKGDVTAFGATSDIRLKENIKRIDDPIDKVKKLDGVTFNYKKDGSRSTGLIAQQLLESLPEVVYENHDPESGEAHYAVRYGNVVGLLVEAVKELTQRIEELENGNYEDD